MQNLYSGATIDLQHVATNDAVVSSKPPIWQKEDGSFYLSPAALKAIVETKTTASSLHDTFLKNKIGLHQVNPDVRRKSSLSLKF